MTPMRPSRIRGNDPHDKLAAIRGERVPDSFWYRQTRRCLVRGIRAHDGFAQNLYGQRPEFTRALNARAIMSNRVPDMNSPEEIPTVSGIQISQLNRLSASYWSDTLGTTYCDTRLAVRALQAATPHFT
ncbi:hypothetical protein PMG11_05984 [Penicillium brasilianum]|uniref:Uncharacterized protein n=1 Tax=Penicillium brasilianum TaxID=104259 RepID=A0A0F7TN50_PENBI|nr:hypothetical protein PMG11_05984 [Penicillium brasilianum]